MMETRAARVGVVDLAGFLSGTWRLDRELLDASGRTPPGSFTGRGTFTPGAEVPGLLRYVERGTVQFGSHRGRAVRCLGYHVAGPWARVEFDDGRYFHDLDLRSGVWEVEHLCRADLYRGRFEVDDEHRWHQQWTVTGPRKDQRIHTVLTRVATDSPR